jgi:hypothetical protein
VCNCTELPWKKLTQFALGNLGRDFGRLRGVITAVAVSIVKLAVNSKAAIGTERITDRIDVPAPSSIVNIVTSTHRKQTWFLRFIHCSRQPGMYKEKP